MRGIFGASPPCAAAPVTGAIRLIISIREDSAMRLLTVRLFHSSIMLANRGKDIFVEFALRTLTLMQIKQGRGEILRRESLL